MAVRRAAARCSRLALLSLAICLLMPCLAPAQQLAKRLILKDGSYQLATQWQVKGDRVRYFSAERAEWEEVPNSMVDWAATEKYEKDRAAGVPPVGAVELDKELQAEREAEEARSPQVAPGLRLPEGGGMLLLDTFDNQPQLVELQQSGGAVNRDVKHNILRAAVNPTAKARQTIDLPGPHAKVQAHTAVPSIYVNLDESRAEAATLQPPGPTVGSEDRYRIIHMQTKPDKRIAGDVKVALTGKMTQEQKIIPASSEKLTGGWVKITPKEALVPGEYAIVEMLGTNDVNLYVWDFGFNPSAPANALALKPEPPPPAKKPDLEQRP